MSVILKVKNCINKKHERFQNYKVAFEEAANNYLETCKEICQKNNFKT
jgi:hypothetical protein